MTMILMCAKSYYCVMYRATKQMCLNTLALENGPSSCLFWLIHKIDPTTTRWLSGRSRLPSSVAWIILSSRGFKWNDGTVKVANIKEHWPLLFTLLFEWPQVKSRLIRYPLPSSGRAYRAFFFHLVAIKWFRDLNMRDHICFHLALSGSL